MNVRLWQAVCQITIWNTWRFTLLDNLSNLWSLFWGPWGSIIKQPGHWGVLTCQKEKTFELENLFSSFVLVSQFNRDLIYHSPKITPINLKLLSRYMCCWEISLPAILHYSMWYARSCYTPKNVMFVCLRSIDCNNCVCFAEALRRDSTSVRIL